MDWRCNWDEEVQTGVGAVSMVSTAGEEVMTKSNYVSWKSQRCYSQVQVVIFYEPFLIDIHPENICSKPGLPLVGEKVLGPVVQSIMLMS